MRALTYTCLIPLIPLLLGVLFTSCSRKTEFAAPEFSAMQNNLEIGRLKTVTLSRPQSADSTKPQILGADIVPGRGMNIYQIRAFVPGKGVVNLMPSPPLEEAKGLMNGGAGDEYGSQSFKAGGAILVPFANRIRGKLSADGKTIETAINGKTMHLAANWKGKNPGAEPHAMHGLILDKPMNGFNVQQSTDGASVTGSLDAGDFEGHWPSKTALKITAALKGDGFGFTVTATNTGKEDLPIGIGWHPYFSFLSGQREQGRLRIPASQRAEINNLDDVFPTGKLIPVKGTEYDFSGPTGGPLGKLFLDDCFMELQKSADGSVVTEIIDPAARYGLRIKGISPEISAFQVYAPPDKQFVAFEPQFNWADPYSPIWKGKNTGMKVLKPGESVTYSVQLELFVP